MLSVENLFVRFGERPLFDGITLRVNDGQRVALAGRNGQGKSTLMKVVAGQQAPERGQVSLAKGRTVGYLPQDVRPPEDDRTVLEEALSGKAEVVRLEQEVRRLTHALGERPDDQGLLARYGKAQAAYEALGGYAAEARAKEVLAGLGFSQARIDGPLRELSGGWLMRSQLARLLLMAPDLLLLDEPTNHLDIETREWLLEFLRGFPGAIVLTSHDRFFLDALVSKVYELESGRLEVYTGNYSAYEVEKRERLERLKASYAKQQAYLRQQEEFIEKNRARAATASNVQSRIKQLEKIEKIELPPEAPQDIRLRFPEPPSSGAVVVRCQGVGKAYGATEVFRGLDLELEAGARLAVVGVNGAGKSTFLRLVAGKDQPSEGTLTLGHNVSIQYFSQYEDDLPDPSWNLVQALEAVAPKDATIGRLRTVLGCFLFSGDDAEKRLGVLSGGERARMKLARMLLRPSNLLVLDEPTNHLDLHSKDLLLAAMADFSGTSVFVSHDRQFLAALATHVLEFRDGRATLFPCGYEQYRWRVAQDQKAAQAAAAAKAAQAAPAKATPTRADDREAARERQKELRRLEKQVQALEQRLEGQEARIQELEALMSQPGFFEAPERSTPAVAEHRALKDEVARGYEALEAAMLELEAAQGG
ncbi:MAG: ABC-F family ATP-binding cassette domain-containing protein [Planctomycetes bacterium]|nr:ABC-F family ATP-binding cassette domain-containing protein [Planctomycetota bacterium]